MRMQDREKKVRVLLVFPPLSQTRRLSITSFIPPLGITSLAAVLEHDGCSVGIVDMNYLTNRGFSCDEALREAFLRMRPHVVGITSTTPAVLNVLKIATAAKEFDPAIYVVAGGPHPSALPESFMGLTGHIDAVVVGEGESVIREIINCLRGGMSFEDISGIVFRKNGEYVRTQASSCIENLDGFPFPARHLLPPLDTYYFAGHCYRKLPVTSMITSRGCAQNCAFCSQAVFGRRFRARSAGSIIGEIEHLMKDYGIRSIMFMDETFTADPKRVYDFCGLLRKKRLDVQWLCFAGVNEVTYDLLKEMEDTGCFQVYYGIESASQRMLDLMGKGISVDDIFRAVKDAKRCGLEVRGQFMLNYPGETLTDIECTIRFAQKIGLDYAEFSVFFPLPGSRVFEEMAAKGILRMDGKEDFEIFQQGTSLFLDPIIGLGELGINEIRHYAKKAYRSFYLRPEYLISRILKMRRFSDFRKNIQALIAVTRGMKKFYKS